MKVIILIILIGVLSLLSNTIVVERALKEDKHDTIAILQQTDDLFVQSVDTDTLSVGKLCMMRELDTLVIYTLGTMISRANSLVEINSIKTVVAYRENAMITDSCRTYSFIYNCDTIRQTAIICILNDTKITFKLISHNKLKNKTASISGTAENKYKNFGASETEEDEFGNLYPVVEYIYDEKCWLSFRFDTQYSKLTIKEADNNDHNPYCPLKSVGVFKKMSE